MFPSRSREEWERQKSYLIRSLFEDLPAFSSIIEELEPTSPDCHRVEKSLADLIIEVEPRKPNPHDDPEEVYVQLAKEMRRLYKRDFLGIDSSTSSSRIDRSQELSAASYDTSDETESERPEEEDDCGIPIMDQSDDEETTDRQNKYKPRENSKSDFTRTLLAVEEVHQEESYSYIRLSRNLETIPESDELLLNETKTEKDTGVEKESLSKSFVKDTEPSAVKTISSGNVDRSLHLLEIVRQGESFTAAETPPHQRDLLPTSNVTTELDFSKQCHSQESYKDVLTSDRELELLESSSFNEFSVNLSSDRELELLESSSFNEFSVNFSSTPLRKRTSDENRKEAIKKKRRGSMFIPSPSEISTANVKVQTSFDSGSEPYFDRKPTVYNICYCDNHVCS